MTNEQREAIETMQHWIEYEKEHKDEINKADELIQIQEAILSVIKEQVKQIDLMANSILAREIGKNSCQFNKTCTKFEKGRDIHCKDCIKQYFERKVEEC